MSNIDRQALTLEDIEEHESARWLDEQFGRIEALVREHGADDEMLEAISYLREENDRWAVSNVEDLDRSGRLTLPDDDGAACH